jgi:dihydrofolate reductase
VAKKYYVAIRSGRIRYFCLYMISLIVAASTNNAIGKNNQLLWHLPNDLKFFKNTTWGMPVIMGRKTFESVNKPLPGRINIVITRQADWKAEGVIVATDLNDALKKAAETNCKEYFIIGGGEIYTQSIAIADKIYLTRVHTVIDDADTFFSAVDENKWAQISNEDFEADEKHVFAYSFQIWKRK